MAAVEKSRGFEARSVDIVEAARVDCDSVRLRPRDVERMHSAMRAECVLGHAGAKGIGRQRVLAAQQFEILRSHGEVEDALFRADRAIALRQQVQIDPRAEAHSAAMAAALAVFKHCYTPSETTFCSVGPHMFSPGANIRLKAPGDGAPSNRSRPRRIASHGTAFAS